jgi:hypothetical protein
VGLYVDTNVSKEHTDSIFRARLGGINQPETRNEGEMVPMQGISDEGWVGGREREESDPLRARNPKFFFLSHKIRKGK